MNEFEIEFDIKPNEFEIELENVIKEVYPSLENLEVTPSVNEQVFNHENSYGYDEVKVKAIQDDNLISENIKNDVEILGVKGTFVGSIYTPRIKISFSNYKGEELDHETQLLNTTYQTTFYNMFNNCTNLKELKLNHWNTSKVTNMAYCFYYNQQLTTLEVSNWNTSNVTTISQMFYYCQKLTRLDLSNWNTAKVTSMRELFYHCDSLKKLDIRNFTFDSVTDNLNMFMYIPKDCEIIVKSDIEKQWVLTQRSTLTNVKTVAEL